MAEPSTNEIHASRFGWFSAGAVSVVAVLTAFFFLGDYMSRASNVEASTPQQIIVGD